MDAESGAPSPRIEVAELPAPSAGRPIDLAGDRRAAPVAGTVDPTALSARQQASWKRFCDGAKGMDSEDWRIVMQTSGPPFNALEEKRRFGCGALRSDFLAHAARPTATPR
jgi:hypothetical protein